MKAQDIIQRKERLKGENTVWVSQDFLLSSCKALSENNLRTTNRKEFFKKVEAQNKHQDMMPDVGKIWRFWKYNGTFYYDYDRLPAKTQQELPPKAELVNGVAVVAKSEKKGVVKAFIVNQFQDRRRTFLGYFDEYKTPFRDALIDNCSFLKGACEFIQVNRVNTSKSEIFILLGEVVADLELRYMPKNYRRMQDKIMAILNGEKQIHESVSIPNVGNGNAKLDYPKDEIWKAIMNMRCSGMAFSDSEIARRIQRYCGLQGYEIPCVKTITNMVSSKEIQLLSSAMYYGKGSRNRAAQNFRTHVPLAKPLYAGDCWQMDGSRVNFIPYMKNGKLESPYVTIVRDLYSGDILGVCMAESESEATYMYALKMACENTGYLPHTLVTDRFAGHKGKAWLSTREKMEARGVKYEITSDANGKAAVERFFRTLQDVFMPRSEKYYGEGILSSTDYAHRSKEYIAEQMKKAKIENYDYAAAYEEAMWVFEEYRHEKISTYSKKARKVDQSPCQVHNDSEKPGTMPFETLDSMVLFTNFKRYKIMNLNHICMTISKVDYIYYFTVEHLEILKKHTHVRVGYDLEDMSSILVYSDDEEQNLLCEIQLLERPQRYGQAADMAAVGKHKQINKNLDNAIKEAALEAMDGAVNLNTIYQDFKNGKDYEVETAIFKAYLGSHSDDFVDTRRKEMSNEEVDLESARERAISRF